MAWIDVYLSSLALPWQEFITVTRRLETVTWRLETVTWRLETVTWRLEQKENPMFFSLPRTLLDRRRKQPPLRCMLFILLLAFLPACQDEVRYVGYSWVNIRECANRNSDKCQKVARAQVNTPLRLTGNEARETLGARSGEKQEALWFEVETPEGIRGYVLSTLLREEPLSVAESRKRLEAEVAATSSSGSLQKVDVWLRNYAQLSGFEGNSAAMVATFYGDVQVDTANRVVKQRLSRPWSSSSSEASSPDRDWMALGHERCCLAMANRKGGANRDLLLWRRWQVRPDQGGYLALYTGNEEDEVWRCVGRWRRAHGRDEIEHIQLYDQVKLAATALRALAIAPESVRLRP